MMTPARYGGMVAFAEELRAAGYEKVALIMTCEGMFMEKKNPSGWFDSADRREIRRTI